jgi:hypothetical protein
MTHGKRAELSERRRTTRMVPLDGGGSRGIGLGVPAASPIRLFAVFARITVELFRAPAGALCPHASGDTAWEQ